MAGGTFSGSNYLTSSVAPSITGYPFTIAGWVAIQSNVTSANILVSLGANASGTTNRYNILLTSSTNPLLRLSAADGSTASTVDTSVAVPEDGTWHHFCGVFTSATSRTIYLDAAGNNTSTTSRTATGVNQFRIGVNSNIGLNNPATNSWIQDVALWSNALTLDEIQQLTAGASPVTVRPASLVNYYPLSGDGRQTIDIMGNMPLTETGTVAGQTGPAKPYINPYKIWFLGQATTAYSLGITAATYTYTPVNVLLKKAKKIIISTSAYTYTPVSILLKKARKIIISAAAYTYSPVSVLLKKDMLIRLGTATYTYTAFDVLVPLAIKIIVSSASFTIQAAADLVSSVVSAAASSITFIRRRRR